MNFNKPNYVTTYEGWKAITLSAKQELVKICLTSFLEDWYYEKQSDLIKRIDWLVKEINYEDPQFVLKLACYSREYWLKSINHYLVAKYIQLNRWVPYFRILLAKAIKLIVKRPDEYAEIIKAYSLINWKFSLPNSLREVIREDIVRFNEYQISKYKNQWDINLYDIVNLCHPKWPVIDKLMNWTLQSADTWEVELSSKGNNKDTWERLLSQNKLWTKALLMNVRNMLDVNVNVDLICERLNNCNINGIFPYEYIRTIWYNKETLPKEILDILTKMALRWFEELPFTWKTAILVDTSWSMSTPMSSKSKIEYVDLASYYWALCYLKWGAVYAWADSAKKPNIYTWDWLIRIIESIRNTEVWCWTFLQSAINQVKDYDNVIVFSDMQCADYIHDTWKIKNIYAFDLSSYKNSIAVKGNIISICGFNDIMFKLWIDLQNLKNLTDKINLLF